MIAPFRERTPTAAMAPRSGGDLFLELLFAAGIASLFLGLKHDLGPATIRLFDPIAALTVLIVLLRFGPRGLAAPAALILHVAYLTWYVCSALMVSWTDGLREGLQVASVLLFFIALLAYAIRQPMHIIWRIAAWLLIAILIYNISWHLANGYIVGWKRLNEPKAVFLVLPALLALTPLAAPKTPRWIIAVLAILMLVIVVLSGERKALFTALIFLIAGAGILNPRLLIAGGVLGLVLLAAPRVDPQGYVARQINSVLNPPLEYNLFTLDEDNLPASFSNAQRQFALDTGLEMLRERPVTGLGTNQYVRRVREEFAYMPDYLTLSIHGEFVRSLVENGIIGFVLYLSAWLVSAIRVLRMVPLRGFLFGLQPAPLGLLLVFSFCLIFSAFESAKSLTLLAFLAPPMLPELFGRLSAPPRTAPRSAAYTPA